MLWKLSSWLAPPFLCGLSHEVWKSTYCDRAVFPIGTSISVITRVSAFGSFRGCSENPKFWRELMLSWTWTREMNCPRDATKKASRMLNTWLSLIFIFAWRSTELRAKVTLFFTLFARYLCSTDLSCCIRLIRNYLDICCFVSALPHRIFRTVEWIHNESKQNKFTNQVVFPGLSRIHYCLGFLPSLIWITQSDWCRIQNCW